MATEFLCLNAFDTGHAIFIAPNKIIAIARLFDSNGVEYSKIYTQSGEIFTVTQTYEKTFSEVDCVE